MKNLLTILVLFSIIFSLASYAEETTDIFTRAGVPVESEDLVKGHDPNDVIEKERKANVVNDEDKDSTNKKHKKKKGKKKDDKELNNETNDGDIIMYLDDEK